MSEVRVRHWSASSAIGTPLVVLAFAALAAAPFWGGRANLGLLTEILAYAALASLWNLLAGYGGLISLGQQAYVGLGAYLAFALATFAGVHPLVAIPLAGVIAAIIAIPAGALLFRLHGPFFAIGTWVVAEVLRLVAMQTPVLGGKSGIGLPDAVVSLIASNQPARDIILYWIALVLLALVIFAIVCLLRSRYGLALTAMRDNELVARSHGIAATRIRVAIYVAAAFGTAMIGALIFLQKARISPDTAFSMNDWSAFVIFIVVIGGIGRIEGPLVGTAIFFLLRHVLVGLEPITLMILAAAAIVFVLKAPGGLWGLVAGRFGWQVFPLQRRLLPPRRR